MSCIGWESLEVKILWLRNRVYVCNVISSRYKNYLYFITYLINFISYKFSDLFNLLLKSILHKTCQYFIFLMKKWTHYHQTVYSCFLTISELSDLVKQDFKTNVVFGFVIHERTFYKKHSVSSIWHSNFSWHFLEARTKIKYCLQLIGIVNPSYLHKGNHAYPNRSIFYDHFLFASLVFNYN